MKEHLISIEQLNLESLNELFDYADFLRPYAFGSTGTRVLDGAVLANLFFEPSTRTRISFGSAFNKLGGNVRDTSSVKFSSIVKGESLQDTSMVISGYCDVVVIRHPETGTAKTFAEASRVPVINGGDGPGEHPSQALLDVYTIQKELSKEPNQIKIAMVGDLKYGRTVHSLAKLLSLYKNIDFRFVAPPEVQMPKKILDYIENKNNGHRITITDDLQNTLEDVEVVYTTRIQQERFPDFEEFSKSLKIHRIDAAMIQQLKNKPVILHPLPRDSRPAFDELSHDLNDYDNLAIFRQTDNGIPVRMAIFCTLMKVSQELVKKLSFKKAWVK